MLNVEKYPNFLNNLGVFKQKDFYSMFAHFSTLRMIDTNKTSFSDSRDADNKDLYHERVKHRIKQTT